MKKLLLTACALFIGILNAQNDRLFVKEGFDNEKALQEAKAKGLDPVDHAGYVKKQYNAWLKQNGELAIEPKKTQAVLKKTPNAITAGVNIDFENGDYTGWSTLAGENMISSNGPLQNLHPVNAAGIDSLPTSCDLSDTTVRHGLMTGVFSDPVCGFPITSPFGGNYVARLNRYCTSYEGAQLVQSFAVTPGATVLNYAYAVVLEDGTHAWGEQTYFKVLVKDVMGGLIDSVYMQAANGTTPGFYPVLGGNGYTYYKPWTPVSVNLAPYIGQTVSVEVTAAACIYSGHSGYAYFDARLDSTSLMPNVWPGDANYDLTADMNDLFYLGWAYGSTGTLRTSGTNNWQAEPSADWGQSTAYGTEFKHADCNGDGTINDDDTTAILLNYGQGHAFKMAHSHQIASLSNYRNIGITPSSGTIGTNQALALNLSLPISMSSPNDLMGIAFRLHVPAGFIASLTSSDFSNSFVGTKGSTLMTISKAVLAQDHIDICLVRKDQQNTTAGGTLADINLLTSNFGSSGTGVFSISHIRAVTYQGAYLPVGAGTASVNFVAATGIQKINTELIKVGPNPANDKIMIDGLTERTSFEILNVIGQPVLKATCDNKKFIDVAALEKGAYFIKLNTAQGVVTRKFIKD